MEQNSSNTEQVLKECARVSIQVSKQETLTNRVRTCHRK
jgi:hypothetical protein